MATQELEQKCINTIRTLAMDAVQQANSGHPGTPMALAPVIFAIYDRYLRHNPSNPDWPNRDRFVLSVGHASMLIYGILHLTGYDLSLDELKRFRQLGGKCAGHPEYGHCPGIETTTGPLGQGLANSVGMAIAQKWLANRFNRPGHRLVDYDIYSLCGDGDLMEGISYEAASLAGHLALNNLVWIYDSNRITIEGSTSLAFSEDVEQRFTASGWKVFRVDDANDVEAVSRALEQARDHDEGPALIIVQSHIAFGAPNKQDTHGAHGAPLGEEEVRLTKENYGWPAEARFLVPEEVAAHLGRAVERGRRADAEWRRELTAYGRRFPRELEEFQLIQQGRLPDGWDDGIPLFPADEKGMATRVSGSKVFSAIAARVPWLIGGSSDLTPSTKTSIAGSASFSREDYSGRNLHFGVREHVMGGCLNGLVLSKLRPFGAQFLIFSDYERPAIRLSALMKLPVIHVFTHDSIGVGEDGPTHQPVEHLASLRAMPELIVIRPADANEVAEAWRMAMLQTEHPVALIFSRQGVPTLDRTVYAPAFGLRRGGYVLADCQGLPQLILIGSGSEIQLCVGAYRILSAEGIKVRVVSLPSFEIFEQQSQRYRQSVLPPEASKRVAVEAGAALGWDRYVGWEGAIVSNQRFGASAPSAHVLRAYGFTVDEVAAAARGILEPDFARNERG